MAEWCLPQPAPGGHSIEEQLLKRIHQRAMAGEAFYHRQSVQSLTGSGWCLVSNSAKAGRSFHHRVHTADERRHARSRPDFDGIVASPPNCAGGFALCFVTPRRAAVLRVLHDDQRRADTSNQPPRSGGHTSRTDTHGMNGPGTVRFPQFHKFKFEKSRGVTGPPSQQPVGCNCPFTTRQSSASSSAPLMYPVSGTVNSSG